MEPTIVGIIEEVLGAADVPFTDVKAEEIAGQLVFRIETEDSRRLIGMRGETIRSLDHLVKKIAEQQGVEITHFLVDVNGYRTKQIIDLQNKARIMAERARSFQYDVELTPMTAYERLIIHATLSDMPDVKTESHGEGRDRRVVIRYVTASERLSSEQALQRADV
jgi:spoIIIJ-associated protein